MNVSCMSLLYEMFDSPKPVVGMVHVQALPGAPFAAMSAGEIVERASEEARVLADAGFDGLIIENMHDRPYLRQTAGPEVVACMTAVVDKVCAVVDLPVGVQILAGANRAALAVAASSGATFIRAENFVFAHVADEGLMANADAGALLRYRREIGAEHVRIFVDIKKKHASHAITADVTLADTAKAAAFFGADGIIVTGGATGEATAVHDVRDARAGGELPVLVGSGVTPENLVTLWNDADGFIVGSYLKHDGVWHQPLDPDRMDCLMRAVQTLRKEAS